MFKNKESKNTEINNYNQSSGNELLECFAGIVLLCIGLYILSSRVMVHSSWYVWSFGRFDISSGIITIPLILGVIWCVVNPKSLFAKLLTIISAILIVVSIILSVKLNFVTTPLYTYIIMFGLIAVGAGLILRTLFKKRD